MDWHSKEVLFRFKCIVPPSRNVHFIQTSENLNKNHFVPFPRDIDLRKNGLLVSVKAESLILLKIGFIKGAVATPTIFRQSLKGNKVLKDVINLQSQGMAGNKTRHSCETYDPAIVAH